MTTKRKEVVRKLSLFCLAIAFVFSLYQSLHVIKRGEQIVTGTFTYFDKDESLNNGSSSYYLIFTNDLYHGTRKMLVTKGYYDSASNGYQYTKTQKRHFFYTDGSTENTKIQWARAFLFFSGLILVIISAKALMNGVKYFNVWLNKET